MAINRRISDGEWEIMKCLWGKEFSTLTIMTATLQEKTGWNNRTIQMMLSRLLKKGLISVEKNYSPYHYHAIVDENESVRDATKAFMEKVGENARGKLMKNFVNLLSAEDLVALKKLVDKK